MLQTAENVAKRYNIPKQRQDEYGAGSQQKACAAQEAGKFKDEIVPITVTAGVADAVLGLRSKEVTVDKDEGLRPGTTVDGIKDIRPAMPGGVVTAGNASQFSDGAGACVIVHESYAQKKGLKPLGRFLGFAVAGCEPDEMGIGPVFAVPKVLQRLGLKVSDIDLWELNEAFAVQVLYSADKLGIPMDRLNVNGGAIAVGHPVRRERPAPHRPRADRGQAARRQARVRHDVHRRRHGRGRRVRGALSGELRMQLLRTPEERFRDLPGYRWEPTLPSTTCRASRACACTTSTKGRRRRARRRCACTAIRRGRTCTVT